MESPFLTDALTHGLPQAHKLPSARPDQFSPSLLAAQGQKYLFTTPLGAVTLHSVQKGTRVKKKLGAGHTGATVLFRIWMSRVTFIRV